MTGVADTTSMVKSVLSYVAGALLLICVSVVGYQQSQITKLDDRIYALQAEIVTEDKLDTAINRLSSDMETRITSIRNEQATTNRWLERVVDSLEKNKK
jgi:ABC-type siderophore export system fused ATPase/permease subunit